MTLVLLIALTAFEPFAFCKSQTMEGKTDNSHFQTVG